MPPNCMNFFLESDSIARQCRPLVCTNEASGSQRLPDVTKCFGVTFVARSHETSYLGGTAEFLGQVQHVSVAAPEFKHFIPDSRARLMSITPF